MFEGSRHTTGDGATCRGRRGSPPHQVAGRWRRLSLEPLEDRRLLTVGAEAAGGLAAMGPGGVDSASAGPAAEVRGRWLFYNDSSFDGNDPAANAADDLAIAPDKGALLPGAGTATLANYTSYSRGINGVMVDVAGLAGATLDATDFVFRYGTGDDPSGWTAAASPASITVRWELIVKQAGFSSSSRVKDAMAGWNGRNVTKTGR